MTQCTWTTSNRLPKMKKKKRIGNLNINNKNKKSGYIEWSWHRKMGHSNNENQKITNEGRNRTTKSRKIQNASRKENLKELRKIGSGHHQTSRDERKNSMEYLRRAGKLLETKLYCTNLIKDINAWALPLITFSGPFLKQTRKEQ